MKFNPKGRGAPNKSPNNKQLQNRGRQDGFISKSKNFNTRSPHGSNRGGFNKNSKFGGGGGSPTSNGVNKGFRGGGRGGSGRGRGGGGFGQRRNDGSKPNFSSKSKKEFKKPKFGGNEEDDYDSYKDEGSDQDIAPVVNKKKDNPNFIQLKRRDKKNPKEEELEIAGADASMEEQFRNFKETQNFQDENDSEDDDELGMGDAAGNAGGGKKMGKKKTGGFQSMGLSALVLKGVLRRGYKVPTPIQRKTIPLILEGKDVVAMARTGSGKTASFLIPLFEKLHINRTPIGSVAKFPRAIILSPTRELAMQTVKFFREIGRFVNLKVAGILGGESMESQFQIIHDKPDVVIATPGRFMHLCVEMELKLDGVEYIVFDEADRLFEMGFGEQVSEIVRRLPESRQTVLFSATLPKLLVEFTKAGLHDPSLIRLDVDSKLPEMLELVYLACRSEDKLAALVYLIKNIIDEKGQTIVFAATKHHVEFIHQLLDEQNISNCYIYSSLDPAARKISIAKFRNGKCNVMIVTDIAARGIDIPVLDNVINFHFPAKPKLFMHRVGRVARAGRSGTAFSIVAPDEVSFLLDLHLFLNRPLKFNYDSKNNDDSANTVGRIPQDVLNEENAIITNLVSIRAELETLSKTCKNGYSQYLKSRPNASTESNRRAKEIEVSRLAVHPNFAKHIKEDPMDSLISQIHTYRPNSTIFEIGPKASSETHRIMKIKRTKDQLSVEKYRLTKSNTILNNGVIRPDRTKKDVENFIPYLPKDHLTETGLCVGTTFDKQIQESVMDITGDDSDMLKTQRTVMKWDQKKKKFVSTGQDTKSKKIKTESGAWIAASYKSDRYKSWKEKSKVEQQSEKHSDAEDSDADDYTPKGSNPSFRSAAFSKRLVKSGKNEAPVGGRRKGVKFNTELKRPEQILKDRKEKEKKKLKNQSSKKKKGKKGGPGKGGGHNSSFRKKK